MNEFDYNFFCRIDLKSEIALWNLRLEDEIRVRSAHIKAD